jgi:hypothetical protein
VLWRPYGAQSVGVLNPGLPAWAISGAGPASLDSDIRVQFRSQLAGKQLAALNDEVAWTVRFENDLEKIHSQPSLRDFSLFSYPKPGLTGCFHIQTANWAPAS